MLKNFYVYIFLDPRKPGIFKYENLKFNYEPFYVGKGIRRRIKDHFKPSRLNDNSHKSNKIKSIKNNKLEPIIIKIKENLSDQEAKNLEISIIKLIGRIDLKNGILTNKTDGGDGSIGYKHSDEIRKKIGNRYYPKSKDHLNYGKKLTEDQKKVFTFKGRHQSTESKIKISESEKGEKNYWYNKGHLLSGSNNPFYGKKHNYQSLLKMNKTLWNFESPDGKVYKNINFLESFCKEHNLKYHSIYMSCRRKNPNVYKGWKVERIK